MENYNYAQDPQDAADHARSEAVDKQIKNLRANSAAISMCSSELETGLTAMSEGQAGLEGDIQAFEWIPELQPLAMAFKEKLLGYANGLIKFCQTQKGNLSFHENSSATERFEVYQ
jgi:hypothetical protein